MRSESGCCPWEILRRISRRRIPLNPGNYPPPQAKVGSRVGPPVPIVEGLTFPTMPEAFAVFAVFAVILVAWVGAWMQARNPASHNAHQEAERLQHHAVWLEQRVELARRENWDGPMIASLEDELTTTRREWQRLAAQG